MNGSIELHSPSKYGNVSPKGSAQKEVNNLHDTTIYTFFNRYIFVRLLLFLLTSFLIIICILYAIGQLSQLRIQDFICENKTIDQIYKHSKENNLPHGTTNGCWISKGIKANSDILFQTRSYKSTDIDNATNGDYIRFILFIIAAFFFIEIHTQQQCIDF